MLDGLHSKERREQIRAASYRAMVSKEECIVVRHKRLDGLTQLLSSRRRILHQRNLSESHDNFGKQGMIQRPTGDRKSGGRGRMPVTDGHYIRPHAVEQQMHGELGGKFSITGKLPAVQIGDDQILGRKHPFIHAGRSGENAAVVQPHGNISFASDDVSALVHPSTGNADFAAVLLFAFGMA